jgi:hypothetical protein
MQAILSSFELDATRRSLVRELSDVDDRQLLDIGLVRAADGSLWLAEDPTRQVAPEPLQRRFIAFLDGVTGLYRWIRRLPLKSSHWRPHFFLRE